MSVRKDFNPVLFMLIDPTLGDFYVLKSGGWVIRTASDGESMQDANGVWWFYDADEGTWFNEAGDPLPNP